MIAALTPRETEVMELVRDGYSNKDIATALGIHIRTVEVHLYACYRKLGTSRRVLAAQRYALLNPRRPEPRRRRPVQVESLGLVEA